MEGAGDAMAVALLCDYDELYGGHSATQFHCPTTGLGGRIFGDRTMLEVLDIGEGGGGVQSLGRYIVAALLNARAGRTPVLTETGARTMWNDCVNQGCYEPGRHKMDSTGDHRVREDHDDLSGRQAPVTVEPRGNESCYLVARCSAAGDRVARIR